MNVELTIAELRHLFVNDGLRVAQANWDSLPDSIAHATTEEQDAELAAWLSRHEANPSTSITRTELKDRLRNRKRLGRFAPMINCV